MKENVQNPFYDVTIFELIVLTLKNWRKILLTGLTFALALAVFQLVPLISIQNNQKLKNDFNSQNRMKISELKQDVEKLQSELDKRKDELKDSIYYNIDPISVVKETMTFYVNSPQIKKENSYVKDLIFAYTAAFNSDEIYTEISNKLETNINPEYLKQIIKAESNYDNDTGFFNVYIIGNSEQQVEEIGSILSTTLLNRKDLIAEMISEHSIKLFSNGISVVVITSYSIHYTKLYELRAYGGLCLQFPWACAKAEVCRGQCADRANVRGIA